MEWISNNVLWSGFMILMTVLWLLKRRNSYGSKQLPPGPKGWPLFGNIFDIGRLPLRSLAAMKQAYGPVVWLNLGSVKTMVVQSAGAAELLFKNHDLSFINRPAKEVTKSHDYYKTGFVLASYNNYWRTLRRICASELFTNERINKTISIRQKCVDDMLSWIGKEVEKGANVEVVHFVFPAILNIIGNLTLSRDLVNPRSEMVSEFSTAVLGVTECMGTPNISDLFPWLRWLDLQGLRRKTDINLGKIIETISGFVEERVKQRQQKQGRPSKDINDFLDVLDFQGSGKNEQARLSKREVVTFIMEMFVGGTETSSDTIEWAMCELMRNPEAMMKIKAELVRVVGTNKKLEESDIDNLHYLRATVEETLRLHPPLPCLVPRMPVRDTNFMGYNIPRGTRILVNVYGIGRDEEYWEDALSFKSERFLDSKISHKGHHFEFLPFGAGRRTCPGLSLGERLLPLVLGSLLHHFEWKVCEGESRRDMSERMGTMGKNVHRLKATPERKTTFS